MNLKKTIEKDVYRYFGDSRKPIFYKQRVRSLKYIIALRKCQYYKSKNILLFLYHNFKLRYYTSKYLLQIPYTTKIGEGLYIGHLGSVIINPDTTIGNNVNLATGITIGQINKGKKKGSPTIGDRVWIGTNAVIVGKITVGNNVLIAPNAYVNQDVPDNSIVLGNPAMVISNKFATEGYVHNLVK